MNHEIYYYKGPFDLEKYINDIKTAKDNTVKDEYDINMYSLLWSFCSLYGWRPRNSGYTAEFQL